MGTNGFAIAFPYTTTLPQIRVRSASLAEPVNQIINFAIGSFETPSKNPYGSPVRDRTYLEKWARELEIFDLLERLFQEME